MRCCHRYPRCAGCQVEDKRFNHAPKNGLRVFVAELAKVLDILRPQNKKKDKQPQLTTLCEDVWLHLYAYSISASVFYSTSCWNCWVQLAPIFSLFIIWYYRDIIGYNCIYLSFLTFSLCIYQYTIQFFNIYTLILLRLLPGGMSSQYYPQIQEACEGDLANASHGRFPLKLLSGFLGKLYILHIGSLGRKKSHVKRLYLHDCVRQSEAGERSG